MVNDKMIPSDLKQNPGMIIGKDEMALYLAFVEKIPQIKIEKSVKRNMS
ncbi:MAG: hypothetical protein HWE34_09800 [Methylocystaceae bacterium]|nr:hypothetical protein [Methylocystaceae bacterium]